MGIIQKGTTVYRCDRCGHQSEDPYERDGDATLEVALSWCRESGEVDGGVDHWWLCGKCATDFSIFIRSPRCMEETDDDDSWGAV